MLQATSQQHTRLTDRHSGGGYHLTDDFRDVVTPIPRRGRGPGRSLER
ncbi:MAG: hypothetical protein JO116_06455 [Planctomycetaceae bacterium]|nr:hypothetical protein [Planctomycetaceae bacterium]